MENIEQKVSTFLQKINQIAANNKENVNDNDRINDENEVDTKIAINDYKNEIYESIVKFDTKELDRIINTLIEDEDLKTTQSKIDIFFYIIILFSTKFNIYITEDTREYMDNKKVMQLGLTLVSILTSFKELYPNVLKQLILNSPKFKEYLYTLPTEYSEELLKKKNALTEELALSIRLLKMLERNNKNELEKFNNILFELNFEEELIIPKLENYGISVFSTSTENTVNFLRTLITLGNKNETLFKQFELEVNEEINRKMRL